MLKQRGCRLNLFNSYFENPFFTMQLTVDVESLAHFINQKKSILFRIKIFAVGLFESYENHEKKLTNHKYKK